MATEQEKKYLERKRAAVQYLMDNDVPKCFQKLLNDVVAERPDDIFGYMVWKDYIYRDLINITEAFGPFGNLYIKVLLNTTVTVFHDDCAGFLVFAIVSYSTDDNF